MKYYGKITDDKDLVTKEKSIELAQDEIASSIDPSTGTVQAKLVSGTNIKTVNSESILGSGDLTIDSGKIDHIQVEGVEQTISEKTVNITKQALGLSQALKFIGISTTEITDQGTENPTISGTVITTKNNGDVVIYNNCEFVWANNCWNKLGDDSSYQLKINKTSGKLLKQGSSAGVIDEAVAGTDYVIPSALDSKATIVVSTFEPSTKATGDFWFDIVGTAAITNNLTNVTKTSGPDTIAEGGTATLVFSATSGYILPDSITVTGASYTYTKASGTVVLSNPTGDVSVTIVGEEAVYNIVTTLTNITKVSGPTTVSASNPATLVFSAASTYELPGSVTVTGASYTWTQGTGTLVLSNPTADVNVTISGAKLFSGLTFTANTAGSTVTLNSYNGSTFTGTYSTDGSTWNTYTPGTTGAITLTNAGDKVYFKGTYTHKYGTASDYLYFTMSGSIAASGNIMSLCSGDDYETATAIPAANQFINLFQNCTALTSAPSLPATTLTEGCYGTNNGISIVGMFKGCTGLTTPPALPATTLAPYCYYDMFDGCTGLTSAPALPATTLANYCYYQMFKDCTHITSVPTLSATTLADSCYSSMFEGCTSITNLSSFSLPASTMINQCYANMFKGCTSLTTPPSLPATTLASYCYYGMFADCSALTSAPSLPVKTVYEMSYAQMFQNCTSLTTPPALPATTLANSCYYFMFYGCTSLASAPTLSATKMAESCYSAMFASCTSLTTPPSLPATTLATTCYKWMFENCSGLTKAPKLPATSIPSGAYIRMFYGCTSLYASDSSGSGYSVAWTIPSSGNGTTAASQGNMFTNCLGTRSDQGLTLSSSTRTLYTQYTPV